MKKELHRLFKSDGWYEAWVDCGGWVKTYRFLYYTKKEVIWKLRHEENVIVSRDFC